MSRTRTAMLSAASAAIVLGCISTSQADLVGWWKFDGDVLDSTANANNGSLLGATPPGFSNDVPPNIGLGQSLSFTSAAGNQPRVEVADSNSLDIDTSITIAAWVNVAGIAWEGIVAKSPSDGSLSNHAGNYELRVENGTRKLTFLWQQGGANDTTNRASTGAIANNVWTHVAVTATKNGTGTFYLDGLASGTFTATNFGAVNNSKLYIGNRADLFTIMDGKLDDVRIYNNVLTAAEVAVLAAAPPPEDPYPGLSPIYARASSEFTADGRLAANAVNGNGIIGKKHVNNPPGGNMWLTDGIELAPKFEIDLGGVYNLSDLRLYNYNENANATCCLGRGVKDVDLYIAGADGVYGALPATSFTFAMAPGTQTDFSELKSLVGHTARYLKMDIKTNQGDPQFSGISEVKVNGTGVAGLFPIPTKIKSVSSNLVGFDRNANYAVNGAGKGFGDRHTIAPDGSMWLSQGTLTNGPADLNPEIVFDLGSVMQFGSMKVWNYNETLAGREDELLGRGIALADILIAGDDLVFTPLITGQAFARAPGNGEIDFGQVVDLLGASGRYIKFDIRANHNGKDFDDSLSDDGLFNFAGLSEVQFFAPVPEPASFGLLAVGSAMLFGRRRRR